MAQPTIEKTFFSHFPLNVQTILVPGLEASKMDKLSKMADKIVEFSAQSSRRLANSLMANATSDPLIDDLSRCLDNLCVSRPSRRNSSHRRCSRSSLISNHSNDNLGWYHQKYAKMVHRCSQPCAIPKRIE